MQSPSRTPPTPSLLAASSPSLLLSRSRLRLVASMFRQMCDAVEACHAQSVFHRDIKPENFIVTESTSTPSATNDFNPHTPLRPSASRRPSLTMAASSSHALSRPSSSTPTRRVVVKLTDFGLSTRDQESSDMDCGSAPYMSYECRNNVAPTYKPKAADVWSLGIVLINMLYHHNPWTDTILPSKSDPYTAGACSSFLQYLQNPVQFFLTRFAGMTLPAARFLSERVFCVPDTDRCSAKEFGEWVSGTGAYAVHPPSASYRPSSSASTATATEDRYGRGGLGVVFGVEVRQRAPSISLAHRVSVGSIPPSRRPSSRASFAPSINVGHISAEPESDQIQDFSSEVRMSKAPLQRQASDTADSVSGSAFFTSRSTSTNKRRKRGARRNKGNNGNQTPTSVASGAEPGAMVDVLAEASQKLAREISRVSHPKSDVIEEVPRTATAPPRVPSVGQPSTSSVRSSNSRQSAASGQSGSSASTTTRRNRRVPYEPPSMWGVPEALCTNNAAPTSRPASGKVATTRRITQNASTSTSSLQGKKSSKWKLSFGKSQLPPVADDAASTMSMDFANADNMSITSFAMGSGPMGKFASPPGRRELSPPRAQAPRPPREPSPTPPARTEPRPHMTVAAANVTDLIMGLNAPVSPATPSTAQSSSFSLDANPVRGRNTLEGNSPHSRPRNFGSPSPSRSVASSVYSADYVAPASQLRQTKGTTPTFAKTPSPHRGGGVDPHWASLSGASLDIPTSSNQATPTAKPTKMSSGRGGSGNWRNSMSSTATGSTSATTSTTAFTRYSNGSRASVSTTATSVSGTSWRAGGGGSISSGHSGKTSPTSFTSNGNGKGGYQTLPRNIKVMNGVPGILHELPRGQNPSLDGYTQAPRKQRTRKPPKDLTLDTINERPPATSSAQKSPTAEGPAGRLADAATSTTDLDGVEFDGQKKVQRGQINALAKMLSALRR
uniref:Expressed protein n=2 Tax=Schizophyllum commune (strain H4-8 / FGSC 9210) TaxID=578458 RepID=D8QCY9_SCHCM